MASHGGGGLPPPEMLVAALFLASFALHVRTADASVHEYRGQHFERKGNAFILHAGSEGLFASSSSTRSNSSSPAAATADAFIRFDKLRFKRTEKAVNSANGADSGKVHAIIFEVEDRDLIGGSAYGGQKALCCTPDLAKLGHCTEGAIIFRASASNPGWPHVVSASFDANEVFASIPSTTVLITQTGMYNMYFICCDPVLADMEIEGKTIWKNPAGYLPGRMAPLMNFYGLMSFAFVVLGIFWFSQYVRFWKEIIQLQNYLTFVIALGMFEMALWYFDYSEFNETGVRPMGITFWAVTFGTIKRTVSRVVILVVSMGFGVVRPTLGGLTSKVMMLGATFFVASEILELVENVGAVNDLSGKARLFLVLPVAILDAFFILWIFISLTKTLEKLQARRSTVKLDIYKKFTNALGVAVVVSIGWIGYEIYFKSSDVFNENWQNAWIIPAFWHVLSFSLLCVLCALWTPSQNSARYAYSDDGTDDFDRSESFSLIRPAQMATKDTWNSTISPDDKPTKGVVNVLPESKEDDIEEDKRE